MSKYLKSLRQHNMIAFGTFGQYSFSLINILFSTLYQDIPGYNKTQDEVNEYYMQHKYLLSDADIYDACQRYNFGSVGAEFFTVK